MRPATLEDADAYTAVISEVTPYQVHSAASTAYWWRTAPPASQLMVLMAQRDGQLAGVGYAGFNTWSSDRGASYLGVTVLAAHRRAGVGAQLYDALYRHVNERGATKVQAFAHNKPEFVEWGQRRGFRATDELRFSRLDLTEPLPPMPAVPAGVSVASYDQVGPEAVYAADVEAIQDEPNDIPADSVAYSEWYTNVWHNPATDHHVSTAVLIADRVVAYTTVAIDHVSQRVWSDGTGTLRAYRGRGLARLAKSVALRRAADAGAVAAFTSNDEVNRPMLAINEWLGYRPCASHRALLLEVPSQQTHTVPA